MKKYTRLFLRIGWILPLLGIISLTTASAALGQRDDGGAAGIAMMGGFMLVAFVFVAIGYIYMALALSTIATKTNTENPWLAWIPLVNIILMLNIAKKPIWWILLFFIPLVGIVMAVIVWMGIAEARNKPNWWGILVIVPVVNIIVPGYLAWSD